ncbi:MAG: galactitol-1-phosphate 5-dehydrogenase [Cytophagales bacterium]|nr:galactitol-1-phosphate 5-dehydrogenase [Cytophagales bacterium]
MKALVLKEKGILAIEERPIPDAPQGTKSVLIKVAACGICGSDIPRGFHGKAYHYPLVMGHEFSGTVAEDGGEFKTGDRVAVFPLIPNKDDKTYATGDYAQGVGYDYFGSRRDGAFEEYLRVPTENLFRIPEHVNIVHASMTEPAAVALHGVRKFKLQAGDTAAVIGAGPIGNMVAQWLRIHGCERVILTDVDDRKLKIAKDMGFEVVNSAQSDPVKTIKDMTQGEGAMRVVEACGLPSTFLQAIQCAAMFGEIVFMGNIFGEFKIGEKDFSDILRKELTIYGTWNSKIVPRGTDDWTTVLKFMDKELIVAPLITDLVPLEQGPAIFDSIVHKKAYHNKVIFKIGVQN